LYFFFAPTFKYCRNFTPDELGRKGEVKPQRLDDYIDNSNIENLSKSKVLSFEHSLSFKVCILSDSRHLEPHHQEEGY
jgi:hypothetical protein